MEVRDDIYPRFLRNYGCAVLATKLLLLSVVLAKDISASMLSSTNAAATH